MAFEDITLIDSSDESNKEALTAAAVEQLSGAIHRANVAVRVLVWQHESVWPGVLLVLLWCTVVLYAEYLFTAAPLLLLLIAVIYTGLYRQGGNPPETDTVEQLQQLHSALLVLGQPLESVAAICSDPLRTRRVFLVLGLAAPLWLLLLRVIAPRIVILIGGVAALSWHSPTATAIRRIFLTLSSVSSVSPLSVSSPTISWENQRKWIGLGWTATLLPGERAPWTDDSLSPIDPLLTNSDSGWQIHPWVYSDTAWAAPSVTESITKFTRRRKWEKN